MLHSLESTLGATLPTLDPAPPIKIDWAEEVPRDVEVPIQDRCHPNQTEAARQNRQKARILLRWSAAGHPVSPLKLHNACRSLRITGGEDRWAITFGILKVKPAPSPIIPQRRFDRPVLGPAFRPAVAA